MDNQHKKISGYRDLTAEEIALMNEIKQMEARALALLEGIRDRTNKQYEACYESDSPEAKNELARLTNADPHRFREIAKEHIQIGFMALVRAVAMPQPVVIQE